MNLTSEQVAAIKSGDAVPVAVERVECVVMRRDIYAKVKQAVAYDESPWRDDEIVSLEERTLNSLDAQ